MRLYNIFICLLYFIWLHRALCGTRRRIGFRTVNLKNLLSPFPFTTLFFLFVGFFFFFFKARAALRGRGRGGGEGGGEEGT